MPNSAMMDEFGETVRVLKEKEARLYGDASAREARGDGCWRRGRGCKDEDGIVNGEKGKSVYLMRR